MSTSPTFHSFVNLPTELRLKIYTLLLPSPLILPIRVSPTTKRYITTIPPCILLSISNESRALYLSTHSLLHLSPSHETSIYVDFTNDTLFFDNMDCSPRGDLALDLKRSPQRDLIRRVAFDVQLWEVLRVFRFDTLSEVGVLQGLRNVALVFMRERMSGGSGWYPVDDGEGAGDDIRVFVDGERNGNGNGTVENEIRHTLTYVDSLRTELDLALATKWVHGRPNVQMWLW